MSAPCCPHPVERHAYNGCANCGCSMRWNEHPRRDYDASPAGLEQNKTYREDLEADRNRLRAQVDRMRLVVERATSVVNERRAKIMHARETRNMCRLAGAVDALKPKEPSHGG